MEHFYVKFTEEIKENIAKKSHELVVNIFTFTGEIKMNLCRLLAQYLC